MKRAATRTPSSATPFFPVGEIDVDAPTEVEVQVSVEEPNAFARLLGAPDPVIDLD